jgi:hypothetical protein
MKEATGIGQGLLVLPLSASSSPSPDSDHNPASNHKSFMKRKILQLEPGKQGKPAVFNLSRPQPFPENEVNHKSITKTHNSKQTA